jgi:hypothetical protein
MAANNFVPKHDLIEVDYTVGPTQALVYRDGGSPPKSFTASQILTNQTGLGTLVSVALVLSVDVGGERFGFSSRSSTSRRGNRRNSAPRACTKGSAGLTPSRTGTRHGGASSWTARHGLFSRLEQNATRAVSCLPPYGVVSND